jgi:hypothetical protein
MIKRLMFLNERIPLTCDIKNYVMERSDKQKYFMLFWIDEQNIP